MLISKQAKQLQSNKHNFEKVRYSIDGRPHQPMAKSKKAVGKKTQKQRIQIRLTKHLSQLPIDPYSQNKVERQTNLIIPHRPHSSLINYQNAKYEKYFNREVSQKQHSKANSNIAANNLIKKIKKHLSFQSMGSAVSKNSLLKKNLKIKCKSRRNSHSYQQQNNSTFKNKLGINRKKYNQSCNQFIDDKQNRDNHNRSYSRQFREFKDLKDTKNTKIPHKKSVNLHSKKHSANNIVVNQKKMSKENYQKSKNKMGKMNLQYKQKSQIGLIAPKNKQSLKQKSSLNVSIQPQKKSEKIKHKPKKSNKFIISKDASSQQEYPVQKYILKCSKVEKQKSINSRSRSKRQKQVLSLSKSRSKSKKKSSTSKNKKPVFPNKKLSFQYSSIYNAPYMNVLSASSNIIRSSDLSIRSARQKNQQRHTKIANKGQHIQNFQQEASSLDIQQIRFFQKQSPENLRKGTSAKFNKQIENDLKHDNRRQISSKPLMKLRISILQQINDKYPVLSDREKIFLASVILIQRRWKQYQFYDKIFKKKSPLKKTEQVSTFLNMKQTKIQSIIMCDQNKSYSPLFQKGQQFDNSNMKKTQDNLKYSEIIEDTNKRTLQQIDVSKSQIARQVEKREIGIQVQEKNSPIDRQFRQLNANNQQKIPNKSQKDQQQPPNSFPYRQKTFKFKQDEVFPSFSYLQVRKQMIRHSTQKSLDYLFSLYSNRKIDEQAYDRGKSELEKEYEVSLQQLKKSKRDIKRGYLKFIECLQENYSLQKQLQSGRYGKEKGSGLRKVSSQSGFMSIVYSKFHQFNKVITENSSSDSDSLKRLSHKILIRKQYISGKKPSSARKFDTRSQASNISNLNNSELLHSERQRIMPNDKSVGNGSDQTVLIQKNMKEIAISSSIQNSSNNMFEPIQESLSKHLQGQQQNEADFNSVEDKFKRLQYLAKQQKVNISDFLAQTKYNESKRESKSPVRIEINDQLDIKWSQKLKRYTQESMNQQLKQKQSKSLQIGDKSSNIIAFDFSDQLQVSEQYYNLENKCNVKNTIKQQDAILQLLMCQLTQQLHQELLVFNNFEQEYLQQENQTPRVIFNKIDQQILNSSSSQQGYVRPRSRGFAVQNQIYPDKQIVQSLNEPHKHNQIGLTNFSQDKFHIPSIFGYQANGHKISPSSSYRQSDGSQELQGILAYLREFTQFIQNNIIIFTEALETINQDQGFSAFDYLKFLRNFQLPQDQYKPVISNQTFVTWETYYFSQHQIEFDNLINNSLGIQNIQRILKQSQTIFHRCLFQAFVSQLQKQRKYGQKGKPFPWQTHALYTPQIGKQRLIQILTKSLERIKIICCYRCGIIDSKYIFVSQEQLERIHQQNEDKIIDMLEDQLAHTPNNWYQLQEHMLELRLEICMALEQQMFDELVKELEQIDFNQNGIQR